MENKELFYENSRKVMNLINNSQPITDEFAYVRYYIFKYPNNPEVLEFKNFIISFISHEFLKIEFLDALNSSEPKYLRIQRIYLNRPFDSEIKKSYVALFTNIYSNYSFYKNCIDYLKQNNSCPLDNKSINEFYKFLEENETLFKYKQTRGGRLNYSDTLELFKKSQNDVFDEDYIEFREKTLEEYSEFSSYSIDEDHIKTLYKSKCKNDLGRVYYFNKIKRLNNSIFTKEDVGPNLGFDIYYQTKVEGIVYENLVKVTSTTNNNPKFSISNLEYEKIKEAYNSDSISYSIIRVYLDKEKDNDFDYSIIRYIGNDTFVSDKGEIYRFSEKVGPYSYFKKYEKRKEFKN